MSTITNRRPFHSASPYIRSRVVRARSSTIAWRLPTKRLKIVDLPTFGRPTMATTGRAAGRGRGGHGGTLRGAGGRVDAAWTNVGRRVVRPAGVAAPASASSASSAAWAAVSAVPAISRTRRATSRRSSIGVDVPPVTPTTARPSNTDGSVRSFEPSIWIAGLPAIPHEPGQLLRVRARAAADDDHQVDVPGGLDVSSWRRIVTGQTVLTIFSSWLAADHERGELLELPRRLGRLADQGHPLLARDHGLPLVLFVDDDRVRREAEHPDDLGVVRRAEQDDRVALLDEPRQLLVLLDHPGAGAVDDLEAAGVGPLHHVRPDAVGADHDRRSVVDVVEGLDGLDPRARSRSAITPSLWTTWPRVWVDLPAARASLALSIASRTP